MPTQPTPEAKEDYNALLNWLMPFAEDMLKKHGEFFPFGAAVNAAGDTIVGRCRNEVRVLAS